MIPRVVVLTDRTQLPPGRSLAEQLVALEQSRQEQEILLAELRQTQVELQQAVRTRDDFMSMVSHELKTPLNGILGMCAVCLEENDLLRIKQSLKTLYKSGKCPLP